MLSNRFAQAFSYASVVHAGQTRKLSRIPYVSHLLIVAGMTIEYGGV